MATQFLDFEKPIEALYEQIENVKRVGESSDVDINSTVKDIEEKIDATRKKIYQNLDSWQRVQVSRHPNRPYTLTYIERISDKFVELKGDRNVGDDNAMVGGLAEIGGQSIMVLGQQ
ncbi:MAG TPA: hypothetical protein VK084_00345, partial [Chitinophagaceae bacterium]|nr:hypothetical protein [Chitinophagaceae bacterium]